MRWTIHWDFISWKWIVFIIYGTSIYHIMHCILVHIILVLSLLATLLPYWNEHNITVGPLISWQSRDSISTVLCHFVRFKSPNEQGGATVESEPRDCQDMRGPTVVGLMFQSNGYTQDCLTESFCRYRIISWSFFFGMI